MRAPWIIRLAAFLAVASPLPAQAPSRPPTAKKIDHISVWHGEKINDPFFWLREKSDPEVIKYLEAENGYTAALTKELQPFADAVYKEMLGHIKQTDLSVPVRRGPFYYYARMVEGKQYPIRCRKKAAADGSLNEKAAEEVLLDQNELARGLKFLSVGAFEVSDDANLLAYTTDTTGFRQYQLHVKDLRTGATLPDSAERVTSVEWCADNRTLFYTTEDPVTKRANMVWRHILGDETEPVYQEKDRLYTVHLGRSKDKKLLFLSCFSTDTWETRFLPSDKPESTFTVVLPREKGHKVHRGTPRRAVLLTHQPQCQELPPGHGSRFRPLAVALERASAAPRRRAARWHGAVSGLPRGLRKIRGPRALPRARLSLRPMA
jgi:oligopeptidase B